MDLRQESESGPAPHNIIPHSGLAIPKDDQALVRQLAEEWTSSSEAGNAAPASAAGDPTRPALPATQGSSQSSVQAAILAQQWRSGSESDGGSPSPGSSHLGPARSLAYAWTSGSEEDDKICNEAIMVFFSFSNFFIIFLEFSISGRVRTKQNDTFYILSFLAFSIRFWLEMKPLWYFLIF